MLKKILEFLFGPKIGKTRALPVMTKILFVFLIIIVASNLTSNYINLILHRSELIGQIEELLDRDLRDIYTFADNQFDIFEITKDKESSIQSIIKKGLHEFRNPKSILLGVKDDGTFLFQVSKLVKREKFSDEKVLSEIIKNREKNINSGFFNILYNEERYFIAYKYSEKWDSFIIRGEEEAEFYKRQRTIFTNVVFIILAITLVSAIFGIFLLTNILRYVGVITNSIMNMLRTKQLSLINLKGAPNDDITFLGMAFNSLSTTVGTLMNIFSKFTTQDIVSKAYRDREVRLEGVKKELTVMFSDIKGFTSITETLGADIIKLLNLHYDHTIREINNLGGIIASIIGDAILVVFGDLGHLKQNELHNKSHQAILAAYKLHECTKLLHKEMERKKQMILKNNQNRKMTKEEERIYRATLLEIGVGIDGGEVFYGTLGSYVSMTNTVIGDNVNSSSRLEGLTRVYNTPVICSAYVKNDVENNVPKHDIFFIEIDTVQVKGKTVGKKIFWPVPKDEMNPKMYKYLENFSMGLKEYYEGDWKKARSYLNKCPLPLSKEFLNRVKKANKAPASWDGIWKMATK